MKTALITGASRGIGAAVARRLHADGYTVALNYQRSRAEAEALAADLQGIALPADVSDPAQARALVEAVLKHFGRLDALVCSAGVAWQGLTQDMGLEEYRRVMGVDLDGTFYCCQAALPPMLHRKEGRIVTLSSMWGQVGGSCEAAYSAAKAGVIGLTRALAKEVGPSGITVNCIAPGVIDTEMNARLSAEDLAALAGETPLGRVGTPEEAAAAITFLASDEASFLTGQVVAPNGGLVI